MKHSVKFCECRRPIGFGFAGDCTVCSGNGLLWDDGQPMTMCPGGGASPVHAEPTEYPCGRHNDTCPGCDRLRADIPTAEDIERTREHRRRWAASER